jgi:chaperone BCS1
MDSIILEPGVKEMLLADCQDFLRSEKWYVPLLKLYSNMTVQVVYRYTERGGFINNKIHVFIFSYSKRDTLSTWVSAAWCARKVRAVPIAQKGGHALTTSPTPSGKTSLIHSLAGELGMDIYVVSLSSKG